MSEIQLKRCSRCGEIKPVSEFNRQESRPYSSNCHDCRKPVLAAYRRRRYASRHLVRLAVKLRTELRAMLLNKRRCSKMCAIVGVHSCGDFRKHIESQFKPGMNWDNYGIKGWEVDHARPVRDCNTEAELLNSFHFTNLRPKWWHENRVGKFVPHDRQVSVIA